MLVLVLLCGGIGVVGLFLLVVWIIGYYGVCYSMFYVGLVLLVLLFLLGLVLNVVLFMLICMFYGVVFSCFDVVINVLGV